MLDFREWGVVYGWIQISALGQFKGMEKEKTSRGLILVRGKGPFFQKCAPADSLEKERAIECRCPVIPP